MLLTSSVFLAREESLKAVENMERLNSKGRTFIKGCALSRDLQTLMVDELVRNGGDIDTSYFPGNFPMWQTLSKLVKIL